MEFSLSFSSFEIFVLYLKLLGMRKLQGMTTLADLGSLLKFISVPRVKYVGLKFKPICWKSQELFNWPMVRGHIIYFINFVLDLRLKGMFSEKSTNLCVYLYTFLSHKHFLHMAYLFLFRVFFAMG